MELIETTLSPVQQRAGATLVPWTDVADQQRRRGEQVQLLAPGDDVMLEVDGRTVYPGRVLRHAGTGADSAYVIMFGDALSRRDPIRRTEQDVEVGVVPAQRRTRADLDR